MVAEGDPAEATGIAMETEEGDTMAVEGEDMAEEGTVEDSRGVFIKILP